MSATKILRTEPPTPLTMRTFCSELRGSDPKVFWHFYKAAWIVAQCGGDPVMLAELTEVPADTPDAYWGWLATGKDFFSLVYPYKIHYEICFAGGSAQCESTGQGRTVRLAVKILGPVDKDGNLIEATTEVVV